VVEWFVAGEAFFIFFFFSLYFLENYSLVFFVVGISTSILILLSSNFFLGPFVKVLFFLISSFNPNFLFFLIWSLFF
jgi:hypothetical protein